MLKACEIHPQSKPLAERVSSRFRYAETEAAVMQCLCETTKSNPHSRCRHVRGRIVCNARLLERINKRYGFKTEKPLTQGEDLVGFQPLFLSSSSASTRLGLESMLKYNLFLFLLSSVFCFSVFIY